MSWYFLAPGSAAHQEGLEYAAGADRCGELGQITEVGPRLFTAGLDLTDRDHEAHRGNRVVRELVDEVTVVTHLAELW